MPDRQFLVIVRAGDRSLHPEWLKGDEARTWDLIVSYYGDDPDLYRDHDIARIDSKGPKWPALYDVIMANKGLIEKYSHIWMPDDDLLIDKAGINRLFETCKTYGLEIAQPALTWDSYSSHLATLHHTNTLIRYSNFVEIMGPCFSSRMLAKSLPLFASNMSGWGLDFVWPNLADSPDTGVAIIDTVTICHTRPIGGPNYKTMREQGVSPRMELRKFCKNYQIDPRIRIHKMVDRNGRTVRADGRERMFALRLLVGCLPALRYSPERRRVFQRMAKMAVWTMFNRPYRVVNLAATTP